MKTRCEWRKAMRSFSDNINSKTLARNTLKYLFDLQSLTLQYLVGTDQVETAAKLLRKVLKRDGNLWEKWIYKFATMKKLNEIVNYIPFDPVLKDTVYEMVLSSFLHSRNEEDHKKFLSIVGEWDSNLYSVKSVITAVTARLKDNSNEYLMDALALLYSFLFPNDS